MREEAKASRDTPSWDRPGGVKPSAHVLALKWVFIPDNHPEPQPKEPRK